MPDEALPIVNVFISFREVGDAGGINQVIDILAALNVEHSRRKAFELRYFYDRTLAFDRYDKGVTVNLEKADLVIVLDTQAYVGSEYIEEHERSWVELASNDYKKEVLVLHLEPPLISTSWVTRLLATEVPEEPGKFFYGHARKKELWPIVSEEIEDAAFRIAERKKTAALAAFRPLVPAAVASGGGVQPEETISTFTWVGLLIMVMSVAWGLGLYFTGPDATTLVRASGPITFNEESARRGGRSYLDPVRGLADEPMARALSVNGNGGAVNGGSNYYPSPAYQSTVNPVGVYRTETYGRYESCQGRDAQGNKPCKRNRRWYIVNEARDIHHQINFTERTHKDIYAIRPFSNGLAQVYFYDGRQMYLEFCVGLDDRVVECVLRP
ncbi:hypothetical protein [Neolewinella persica]|uniref:hypothetical protein n=1 Tax=Neolewinella persica TaxID=70998 RepID=UPI000371B836|nr:hypothetical protein [Neolewinella persica]